MAEAYKAHVHYPNSYFLSHHDRSLFYFPASSLYLYRSYTILKNEPLVKFPKKKPQKKNPLTMYGVGRQQFPLFLLEKLEPKI